MNLDKLLEAIRAGRVRANIRTMTVDGDKRRAVLLSATHEATEDDRQQLLGGMRGGGLFVWRPDGDEGERDNAIAEVERTIAACSSTSA